MMEVVNEYDSCFVSQMFRCPEQFVLPSYLDSILKLFGPRLNIWQVQFIDALHQN